jgi:hypothetical protein
LLIRGLGPVLSNFSIANFLPAPQLTLFQQTTALAQDAGWGGNPLILAADAAFTGLPLTNPASLDSALLSTLGSNGYTVKVSAGTAIAGQALGELYDATPLSTATSPRLINLSCLQNVQQGATLTAGFVIQGSTSKTVLIRATGPGLSEFGLSNLMPDPQLTLFKGQTVLLSNAAWLGDPQIKAAAAAVSAFSIADATSHDAALLATLPPGSYTAPASSSSGTPGQVILEVYEVP